jgi:hypothetical protein
MEQLNSNSMADLNVGLDVVKPQEQTSEHSLNKQN